MSSIANRHQALPFRGSLVVLEDIRNTFPDHSALLRIRELAADTDPLYAIFTSGSTGVPKGVAVCHRSVLDFIPQFTALMGIEEEDVLGNQAPFDFDVSVKDIYSALYSGATVHIIPRAYFSFPTKLMDYLCERRVTTLVWAVSAMCFVSTMRGFDYRVPADVRKVIFSGEVMPVKHLNIWRTFLPRAKYFNVYGPTEITCNCTYYAIERSFSEEEILPIGRPFPNERVFLLDEEDHLVTAPGALGELCVSGTALALGYYNDPERTAQVFVQNPLHHRYPETIYRTGDLARYDQDGNLVYVSRKDFQIKHMGHRIELGEIDARAGTPAWSGAGLLPLLSGKTASAGLLPGQRGEKGAICSAAADTAGLYAAKRADPLHRLAADQKRKDRPGPAARRLSGKGLRGCAIHSGARLQSAMGHPATSLTRMC